MFFCTWSKKTAFISYYLCLNWCIREAFFSSYDWTPSNPARHWRQEGPVHAMVNRTKWWNVFLYALGAVRHNLNYCPSLSPLIIMIWSISLSQQSRSVCIRGATKGTSTYDDRTGTGRGVSRYRKGGCVDFMVSVRVWMKMGRGSNQPKNLRTSYVNGPWRVACSNFNRMVLQNTTWRGSTILVK